MKVFVTGATGFVGSAVIDELLRHKYKVVGLARSEDAAHKLQTLGIDVQRGDLDDHPSLVAACNKADAVIHTGFHHDFKNFAASCALDKAAIEVMGEALMGTQKPFIVTSGLAGLDSKPNQLVDEDSEPRKDVPQVRQSEASAMALAKRGIHACVVRLGNSVHAAGDHAFVPFLATFAKKNGFSAYVEAGQNRWTAVHRLDAAVLYRLVLEKGVPGACYNGCAEEGIALKDIATTIGKQLKVETRSVSRADAPKIFEWFAHFAAFDCAASSKLTQERLGWAPHQPKLLEELNSGTYFSS